MSLYLSIFLSITTELFPNLGLSYFYPSDKSINFYDDMEIFRWIVAFVVWIPISMALYKLSPLNALIASFLILCSFFINKNSSYKNKLGDTGILHVLGFAIIYYILIKKETDNNNKIKYMIYIILLLFGGYLMGKGRNKNLIIDILGRIIFSIGFYKFVKTIIYLIQK